jgi:predicted O-methyltransferase YrrM
MCAGDGVGTNDSPAGCLEQDRTPTKGWTMDSVSQLYGMTLESVSALSLESLERHIGVEEYRTYFRTYPREHYRLLAFISSLKDGVTLFDVGTLYGYSALAFSYNPENHVISYNLVEERQLRFEEDLGNIEFCVGDVLSDERLLDSAAILLDTAHDGHFERLFLDHLRKHDYRGLLILDDIHLNPAMELVWREVDWLKEDATNMGHWSGTGLVRCGTDSCPREPRPADVQV